MKIMVLFLPSSVTLKIYIYIVKFANYRVFGCVNSCSFSTKRTVEKQITLCNASNVRGKNRGLRSHRPHSNIFINFI